MKTLLETYQEYKNLEDLEDIAQVLGYNKKNEMQSMEPKEAAYYLSEQITEKPLTFLKRLSIDDLRILTFLMESGPDSFYEFDDEHPSSPLFYCGILSMSYSPSGTELAFLTDEMKIAIAPHLKKVIKSAINSTDRMFEQLILGILNLYGYIEEENVKSILNQMLESIDEKKPSDLYLSTLKKSASLTLCRQEDYQDGRYSLISPFCASFGDIIKTRKKHPEIADFYGFSAEEFFDAGDLPFPVIPNPSHNSLKKLLKKRLKHNDDEVLFYENHLWLLAQEDLSDPNFISEELKQFKFESIEDINEASGIIIDYLNHIPRWAFKGYCPNDMKYPAGSPCPTLVAGPNMKAAGLDITPEIQAEFDKLWNDAHKPGRNDPCPCGSGKKYKNCCGK